MKYIIGVVSFGPFKSYILIQILSSYLNWKFLLLFTLGFLLMCCSMVHLSLPSPDLANTNAGGDRTDAEI